jgi:hypothetical protein
MNNAWKTEIKDAAKAALSFLSEMPKNNKANDEFVLEMMDVINNNLGNEFAAELSKPTKLYLEKSIKYGLNDVKKEVSSGVSIGIYGIKENKVVVKMQQQHLFWIGNRFDSDLREKFQDKIISALGEGITKHKLADLLKQEFKGMGKNSDVYWQGLAEHTSLRVRQFGRLEGYRKSGASHYRLKNPMDHRTSDICRALISENRLYKLSEALEVRDKLLNINPEKVGLDRAKEEIKALAPWVKESSIVRDKSGNPIGVTGSYSPFPPFHWKCRTKTEIVI